MIVAHRGGMAYAPENTVAGFVNGQRLETDILEMDVQVRGNEVIVLHDDTLDRTTDCSMESSKADALTRASCDAGFTWRAGTTPYSGGVGGLSLRGKGIRIPILAGVVDGISNSNAIFMIELKHFDRGAGELSIEQAMDTLITFIVERSLENRIWLVSFNAYIIFRAEAMAPTVSTMLVWASQMPLTCEERVLDAISRGIDGVAIQAPWTEPANPDFTSCVQIAQNAGMVVAFWLVNRPGQVEYLLQFKPDMMMTDFPACLAALLRDVRIANPYPDEVGDSRYLPKCG